MTAQGSKPRIVIIGAGATGRGHIGQLAHSAGWAITFIERRPDLVDRLRETRRFRVGLAGERVSYIDVGDFDTYHIDEMDSCAEAIAGADIVATAVIPTNLRSTVPTLAAGLELRWQRSVKKPLNVIACENMERSSSTLRGHLETDAPDLDWDWIAQHIGFPDSMVARAVPQPKDDPLSLLAEANQEWSVDAKAIREPMPALDGMTLSENQEAALERKLYIKNTGHMAIGVLGYLRGYELMDQAARDPEVFELVDAATRESAAAVVAKHGFPADATESYRAGFLEQMKSPFLPDDVTRVVREPIRKLTREERLIGPAMLACEQGSAPRALARVIAAALTLDIPGDPQCAELRARVASDGADDVLREIGGVPAEHRLAELVHEELRST